MENKKIRILAIDDNKDNLFTLKILIKEKFPDAIVLEALSGKIGIKIAEAEEPNLILLDVVMPEMDGFEVCERLKLNTKTSDIPVLFVTALGDKSSKIKALESGGEGFLTKPIDDSELTAQIRAMLKIYAAKVEKINEKERLTALVAERTIELEKELSLRKQTEEDLIESVELNKSITESVADAIICINSEGLIMSWNKSSEKIFGYTASEMISDTLEKILPSQFKSKHENGLNNLKKGGKEKLIGKSIEVTAMRKDGVEFPIELSLSSWEGVDTKKYFTGIIRDITQRKLSHEKLINSEQRLSQIINNSKDWIWEVDVNGLYTYASSIVEDILGYSSSEIVGKKHFYDFFQKESRAKLKKVALEAFKEKKTFHNFINKNITKNGDVVWISTSGIPILDNKGKLIGYRGADSNITKRKLSEQQLKEQNLELIIAKDKAEESDLLKTEFLNNMSHEIRTPMNGILGFSEMLSLPDLAIKKRENFVKIIQNSGKQLLKIIDDILEISRLGTKQVEVYDEKINLNDLLFELFSIFDIKAKENKTPLYLVKGLSDKKSMILIDKSKLNKILYNLLENALKFTSVGFIEFGYKQLNSKLEIYVKDTGMGVDKVKHESIFERFSQAEKDLSKKTGGLGLGLSIAKENTELLEGSIRVESEKGAGAKFIITLPYKPVFKTSSLINSENIPPKQLTILIAEDEEVNFLYLETLLKDIFALDCDIIHAKNGKEAVEIYKDNSTINLVLMDLKMPEMNGYYATKQLKQLNPNLIIIAQTAYSRPEERSKAKLAGCDNFISKPISKAALQEILEKYSIMSYEN